MNRTCAVCGRPIYKRDICNGCFKTWCIPVYPEWVKELVRIQSHFDRCYAEDEEYLEEL